MNKAKVNKIDKPLEFSRELANKINSGEIYQYGNSSLVLGIDDGHDYMVIKGVEKHFKSSYLRRSLDEFNRLMKLQKDGRSIG